MRTPDKTAADIFQAGMDARSQGAPAIPCPYREESGEGEQWLKGWRKPDEVDEPPELGFA